MNGRTVFSPQSAQKVLCFFSCSCTSTTVSDSLYGASVCTSLRLCCTSEVSILIRAHVVNTSAWFPGHRSTSHWVKVSDYHWCGGIWHDPATKDSIDFTSLPIAVFLWSHSLKSGGCFIAVISTGLFSGRAAKQEVLSQPYFSSFKKVFMWYPWYPSVLSHSLDFCTCIILQKSKFLAMLWLTEAWKFFWPPMCGVWSL